MLNWSPDVRRILRGGGSCGGGRERCPGAADPRVRPGLRWPGKRSTVKFSPDFFIGRKSTNLDWTQGWKSVKLVKSTNRLRRSTMQTWIDISVLRRLIHFDWTMRRVIFQKNVLNWLRDGLQLSTSERTDGLEQCLAWRPSGGSLIASTQRLPNKHQVCCRHWGGFD